MKEDKWKAKLYSILLQIISTSGVYSKALTDELSELIAMDEDE